MSAHRNGHWKYENIFDKLLSAVQHIHLIQKKIGDKKGEGRHEIYISLWRYWEYIFWCLPKVFLFKYFYLIQFFFIPAEDSFFSSLLSPLSRFCHVLVNEVAPCQSLEMALNGGRSCTHSGIQKALWTLFTRTHSVANYFFHPFGSHLRFRMRTLLNVFSVRKEYRR